MRAGEAPIVETPNPVPEAERHATPDAPGADGRFTLLSVGRLGYQKNFQVLLAAFERLAPRFPDWDLRIVGEGEDRAQLESIVANSSQLAGRVFLPGATRDIAAEYVGAQLFCLPSRWEGFPNALAEALAHGLPSVGFEECSGVPDLIENGRSGTLATGMNEPDSLAQALSVPMVDAGLRKAQGRSAVLTMRQYRPEECFDRWEQVLVQAVPT